MVVRRKREEIEARLVSEYVASVYPDATVHLRCWIGPLPAAATALDENKVSPRMYEVVGKWADAIALYPHKAILIEGKLKANASALGQLLVYHELFGKTEKFRGWWNRPRELILLYAFGDKQVQDVAESRGVICHRYCPAWAKEAYLTRMRRAY